MSEVVHIPQQETIAAEHRTTEDLPTHAAVLALASQQLVAAALPRNKNPSPLDELQNPYTADTPMAAEARLRAAHEAERAAHHIGRLVAMREIEKGNVSRKRAAELLSVHQMTVGRWYKEYHADKAELPAHLNQNIS
jgi:hypothetical protein